MSDNERWAADFYSYTGMRGINPEGLSIDSIDFICETHDFRMFVLNNRWNDLLLSIKQHIFKNG